MADITPNRARRWKGYSRSRRAAFAATALLAGCATVARDSVLLQPFTGIGPPGLTTAVLFRIEPPGAAGPAELDGARAWALDGSGGSGFGQRRAPSPAARDQGWVFLADVRPGTWFMRLEGSGYSRAPASADLTFRIAPAPPAVSYIGTFRVTCGSGGATPCRLDPVPMDESAAAAALVNAEGSGLAAPATALARPYPPSLAATGLQLPAVPEFRVDTRQWLAAIDWSALGAGGPPPAAPPAEAPRSEAPDWSDATMVSTASGADALGLVVALPVYAAALLVMLSVEGISRAIIRDQRNRRTAEEARREAETLRAAALAQERWGPCSAGIAATLAPDNVERHLRATLAPDREAGRRTALPGPWQATVTRVILRHCGTAPDQHGIEVATRWTATRPGEAEPGFDAVYSRTVQGATPDVRLVQSSRAPWELPVASEAACRPLADYCGAGGSALLLQEVMRGVTEARDAIAAGR